jgi:aspartate racemase
MKKGRQLNKSDLTVGVVGGMGPVATEAFFRILIGCTEASRESDHLRVLIDSNPRIPSRTRAFLYGETSPAPMIRESALNLLSAGAQVLALPCNSAHYFLPEVCAQGPLPFVNMIEETCDAVFRLSGKPTRVGLIAGEVTVESGLYLQPLRDRGIELINVSPAEQRRVREIIEDVKAARASSMTSANLSSLVSTLSSRGAEAVILGCTELPLVSPANSGRPTLVDSAYALAKAVVRRAKHRLDP